MSGPGIRLPSEELCLKLVIVAPTVLRQTPVGYKEFFDSQKQVCLQIARLVDATIETGSTKQTFVLEASDGVRCVVSIQYLKNGHAERSDNSSFISLGLVSRAMQDFRQVKKRLFCYHVTA